LERKENGLAANLHAFTLRILMIYEGNALKEKLLLALHISGVNYFCFLIWGKNTSLYNQKAKRILSSFKNNSNVTII